MLIVFFGVLMNTCNASQPFSKSEDSIKGPWLPFSDFSGTSYEGYKSAYRKLFGTDVKDKPLEEAAVSLLKMLILARGHQSTVFFFQSTGARPVHMGTAVGSTWSKSYGIVLDQLFLKFTLPSLSEKWYTRFLAARDTLHDAWISHPATAPGKPL